MALAPSRQVLQTVIKYSLNEASERGRLCTIVPNVTTAGEVTVSATPTGVGIQAIGILLDDVESMNFDRHPMYRQRNVSDVGSVVGIMTKGDCETDQIIGSPVAGQTAYLGVSGMLTTTQADDGLGNVAPRVGYFQTAPNANGFASVHIDL